MVLKVQFHRWTCTDRHQEINDLATSPDNPQIIASASDDTTVRLWSLDPVHSKQPCVCLLGGEGHSWSLLSAVSTHMPQAQRWDKITES